MKTKFNRATHPDFGWCSETSQWEHKDRIVRYKIIGSRFLHHGRGRIGFTVFEDKGFTVVKTFVMKNKSFCSTYYFNGKPTINEIQEKLFDNARHFSTLEKQIDEPYGVIYRYAVVPADEWDEMYEPNVNFGSIYKTVDKAFKSLGKCISLADGDEILCKRPHIAFLQASKKIASLREAFIATADVSKLPVVEVYAIWSNYDPETLYVIREDYDAFEPLHYTFNRFKSLEQMKCHPM